MDIPKYTKFELGKMVKEKRINENLSPMEVAARYGISRQKLQQIEKASCLYNVRIYDFVSHFLNLSQKELLEKEPDNIPAFEHVNEDIKETVLLACRIFDEMIMQEKIATH